MANYKFYEALIVKSKQRALWLDKLFDIFGELSPELNCDSRSKAMSGCFNANEWYAIKFTNVISLFRDMEDGYKEKFCTLEKSTIDTTTLLAHFPDLFKLGDSKYEKFSFDPDKKVNYRCEYSIHGEDVNPLHRDTYKLFFEELTKAIRKYNTDTKMTEENSK